MGNSTERIWLDMDNVVTILGVQDAVSDAFQNNGTISGSLQTEAGVEIKALTGAYEAATDGDYYLEIDKADVLSSALTEGTAYLIVAAVVVSGKTLTYTLKRQAAKKRE